MASNTQTLADEDGDYSDWIEILNISSAPVNLNGWALTDDPARPRRWRFPAVIISPGQHLIVFASDKDRRVPGSPLHTSFKLSSDGDFLAISDSTGTIVHSFSPGYPAQVPDVSYGLVSEEESSVILPSDADLKFWVPENSEWGEDWRSAEFTDSTWTLGRNGVAYQTSENPPAEAWVASAVASEPKLFYRFEEKSGTVAVNSGSLGSTHNASLAAGPSLNQTGIRPPVAAGMPETNVAVRLDGRDDFITTGKSLLNNLGEFSLAAWINPTQLRLGRVGLWGQHQAIEVGFIDGKLLQVSTAGGGTLQAEYPYAAPGWHHVAVTGDGLALRIYVDGELLTEGELATQSYGASLYPLVIGGGGVFDASQNWFTGHIDEFTFHDRALSGDELFLLFQSAKVPEVNYGSILATNVEADMKGKNSSLYLRQEFALSSSAFDGLLLNVQTDDGFAAYLNGVEVARVNAPEDLAWNSDAPNARAGSAGLQWLAFNISPWAGLLHEGRNVLAVQALNAAPEDSDFLFRAEMLGISRRLQTNSFRYFTEATPGAINGSGDLNAGPLILSATHAPTLPDDSDAITVTAQMMDTFEPATELLLTYRVMFAAEQTLTMRDNGLNGDGAAGDGVFGARIPANAASQGQMVRWYLRARDQSGNLTRWPPYRDSRNSPQYLGTMIADTRLNNPLPVLHWFVQNPSAASSSSGTRGALFWNGVLYDNIFANLHGQSSQGFPKKSYNFDFNTGYKFVHTEGEIPVGDMNLLTTYPDKAHVRNILAYETFRDAGHSYHYVIPVRVQQNGSFFSDAHIVEDGDDDFLERVGLDRNGALYKMYNSLDSATSGAEKKTRKFENNTDLQQLLNGLRLASAARTSFIFDNINIPAVVNYAAALVISGNVDCCHKNYYLYRDSEGTGEWQVLPWDLDLSFGRNWTSSLHYYDDNMYANNNLFVGSNNTLLSVLYGNSTFRQMYLRRLRTLMDELLQPPGTPADDLKYERRIRELYAQIGPDAALDFARWPTWGSPQTMPQALSILTNQYLPARRNFLYVNQRQIPAPETNALPLNFGPLEFNPASGLQSQEYFTLVNPNNLAIDLSRWTVEGAVNHTFVPGTVIPPNGRIYLSPDVNGFRLRSANPRGGQGLFVQGNYRGQLSARGETLVLKNRAGETVQTHTYIGTPTAAQQSLRIVEILYAPVAPAGTPHLPEDLEYLVLKNIGAAPLDLDGVHFANGISFGIHGELILEPGEHIYLAKNRTAFEAVYGTQGKLVGDYLGQLSNEGETIELFDGAGEKILDFRYGADWFAQAESQGHSLVILDPSADYSTWDARESWGVSAITGGSAGGDAAWTSFVGAWFTAPERADATVSGRLADPDQDGHSNYDEFVAATNPRDAASHFQIEARSTGAGLNLRFTGVAGRTYTVLTSAQFPAAEWSVLSEGTLGESGTILVPVGAPADESRFFKVSLKF